MGVNKVVMNTPKGEQTIMDITDSTITPETMAEGAVGYNAEGERVVGTAKLSGDSSDLVPDYYYQESARVIEKILAFKRAHPNSLVFGEVSDIHVIIGNESYEEGSKASVNHAAFALETIGAMTGCDFIVNAGDMCWENGSDTDNAYQGSLFVTNKMKKPHNRLVSFSLVGNHDKNDNTQSIFDLIGQYNDFDVWADTQIRSYGYKDFTDKKVRVICLNTSDYLNVNGGCALSYEQKDFLMRALDLSSEIDYSDWQILLLSHIPLDWNGGDYNFYADLQAILNAYEDGTTASIAVNSSYAVNEIPSNYATYSNGKLVYNFSGKNSAKIIANIHGHVHTNKVSKIANTRIARVATANANPYQDKSESYPDYGDYSITTAEANKIQKVVGTAKDTSVTFYCIDLNEQVIYAYGYGADIDRTVVYSVAPTYSVVYNLTKCTSINTTNVAVEGGEYVTTITPVADAVIDSVVVTMGGVDITATAYADGVISIPSVTGDIVITAAASIPLWSETLSDLAVAIRQEWYYGSGKVQFNSNNSSASLAVTTPNDGGSFADRENNTVYMIPVSPKASKVSVARTDGKAFTCRYHGIKAVGDGTFTRLFDSADGYGASYEFTKGTIDYLLIEVANTDGTSWAWEYDDSQISVTFTNE